ncbi:MAG TPA: hypothetical protein VHG93_26370 [Longimicrobium sp.]|nr:hypothetical protein [Longimicrobium sp.]
MQDTPEGWDGTQPPRIVSPVSEKTPVAVVEFLHACAHLFGPPNDERWSHG